MNVLYLHDTGVNTKELHIVLNLMKNLGYIDLTISKSAEMLNKILKENV